MRNGAETTPEFYDLPEAPDYVSYHSWNKAFEDAPPHEAKAKAEEGYKHGEYAQENNDAVRERSAAMSPYSAMLRDRRRKDVALDLAAQLAGEYGYWAGNGCGSLI